MANQDFIQQIVQSIASNPQMLDSLAEHPYSTVSEATGGGEVSRDDVSQALAAVSLLGGGKAIDFGSLAEIASQMLGQSGGSAHNMAASLFGGLGAPSAESGAFTSASLLNNLANVNFEGAMAGVDLSDGIGLDDVMNFASGLFRKK